MLPTPNGITGSMATYHLLDFLRDYTGHITIGSILV